MRWSLIYHLMPTILRACWLTLVEVNVFRHLVGLKVTLAVTDQSVLAEQTSSHASIVIQLSSIRQ